MRQSLALCKVALLVHKGCVSLGQGLWDATTENVPGIIMHYTSWLVSRAVKRFKPRPLVALEAVAEAVCAEPATTEHHSPIHDACSRSPHANWKVCWLWQGHVWSAGEIEELYIYQGRIGASNDHCKA